MLTKEDDMHIKQKHDRGVYQKDIAAEDEAACEAQDQTIMEVPTDLVPTVRDLIAKRKSA